MLHRSLFMLPTLLSLSAAGATGCNEAYGTPPEKVEGAKLVSVLPLREAQAVRYDSGMKSQQRLVVRDAATWANVWKEMTSPFRPIRAVPAVDFAKNVLIVAAMGAKASGGYWIDVDEVRIAAGEARVSVSEHSPGSGCIVLQASGSPVAVVVVPRFAGHATFVERILQHECR